MKSLIEIYTGVWDCYDYTKDTTENNSITERMERGKQAANTLAFNLIALGDRWVQALENNIEELAASKPSRSLNRNSQKAYMKGKRAFLIDVCNALNIHGFNNREIRKQLTPFACYFLGLESSKMVIKNELQRDEAEREFTELKKQGFSQVRLFKVDLFPDTFTLFGYKATQGTPEPQQSKAAPRNSSEPLKSKQGTLEPHRKSRYSTIDEKRIKTVMPYIEECIKNGLCQATDTNGVYLWKPAVSNPIILLVYMAREVSTIEHLSFRKYDTIQWHIFEKLFNIKSGTLKNNYNSKDNKSGEKPSNHEIIDKIINAVWKKK